MFRTLTVIISSRYNRSQGLAAIVTLIAIIGTAPNIALQFKAVTTTFDIITLNSQASWIGGNVGPIVASL